MNDIPEILIVEDHESTLQTLVRVLDRTYHVHPARTVGAGLAALQEQPFDLLLCDWNLPDGTAADLVAALEVYPPAAVLMSASSAGWLKSNERVRACFQSFLEKPYTFAELDQSIRTALAASRPEAGPGEASGDGQPEAAG